MYNDLAALCSVY